MGLCVMFSEVGLSWVRLLGQCIYLGFELGGMFVGIVSTLKFCVWMHVSYDHYVGFASAPYHFAWQHYLFQVEFDTKPFP